MKEALDKNDIQTLKDKLAQLEQAAAYAQQYQNQAQSQGAEQPDMNSSSSNDDVIDADFNENK